MSGPVEPLDWPPTADLVEAVREFLERDVMGATSGRTQYLTRVAVNVLAGVARELADHEGAALQRMVFDQLGASDEADLCRLIRSGELDERLPEVTDQLERLARHRVAISNPRYLPDAPSPG